MCSTYATYVHITHIWGNCSTGLTQSGHCSKTHGSGSCRCIPRDCRCPAGFINNTSGAPENLRKNAEWRTSSPLQSSLINLCYQTCSMKYDRKRYGVCMEYARHRYDICTKYGWNLYHHHTMEYDRNMYRINLEQAWSMYGIFMELHWTAMEYAWIMDGIP